MDWRVVFCIFSCLCIACSNGACDGIANNKRSSVQALSFFNEEIQQSFVGQFQAVRIVRDHVQDFLEMPQDEPLVLHLVGPSGTGKSFMAEILARSLFHDCKPRFRDKVLPIVKGAWDAFRSMPILPSFGFDEDGEDLASSWLTKRTCANEERLDNWRQACGIVYGMFHNTYVDSLSDDRSATNEATMNKFLDTAAKELLQEPNSILILDDFNFCRKECANMLKELLLTKSIMTESGKTASASKAVIVLCSDLTDLGLVLDHTESYESALERVMTAAKNFWGETSHIIVNSVHVPFAPLSDLELVRILERTIASVADSIKRRVTRHFHLKSKQAENSKPYVWEGRLFWDEETKVQIINKLHREIDERNARAITEIFKENLKMSIKTPQPIEKRLDKFKQGADKFYCTQDIAIKVQPKSNDFKMMLEIV